MPKAIRTVAAAVTADAFGVRPRAVRVDLDDDRGLLRVSAAAPIRVGADVPAKATSSSSSSDESGMDTAASVLERVERAQTTVRRRLTELTGAQISAVDLTVTDAVLTEERRVR